MIVKGICDEDFINYKQPSMMIITSYCSFKCDIESGMNCCQNSSLANEKTLAIPNEKIIERYIQNPITKSIVFGGLEPFEQFEEMFNLISTLRFQYQCNDTVIIYTGFNKGEIIKQVEALKIFKNIIIKFGRFIPNQKSHYDKVLGVKLQSDNQYAEEVS